MADEEERRRKEVPPLPATHGEAMTDTCQTGTCMYCGATLFMQVDDLTKTIIAPENCPRCRDQFAMAAPAEEVALLLAEKYQGTNAPLARIIYNIADMRYTWADAMMKARQK